MKDILAKVHVWLGRRSSTKRELLSLIGTLSFATKVVPAGRLFLRHLIDLSTTLDKLHHHIRHSAEGRADLAWWAHFLPSWNGRAMFLDPKWISADSLNLFTVASGSLGFGAFFNGECMASLPKGPSPLHTKETAVCHLCSCWHLAPEACESLGGLPL